MPAFSHRAYAAAIIINHAPTAVAQGQQFYVDVTIDPQNKPLNGIQGSIVFSSDTLSFIRAETGTSNITLFIDKPAVTGNTITYSGIIPSGFNGMINPYTPGTTFPGQIMRLVFVGKAAGEAHIIATNTSVTDNDGQGTLEVVPDQRTTFSVSTAVAPSIYQSTDTRPPTLTASIIKENDLYKDRYTLIFNAIDKQSGIDHVEVKEGNDDWQTAQSPYVLHDQSRKGILSVRAFDMDGNISVVVTIPPTNQSQPTALIVLIITILLALSIVYAIHKKRIQDRAI